MASTTHPVRRRESVCRSLFGPVDREQLRRDLKQRLKEISEQDSRRWNFNFQTETPLPGRFQWEEIPSASAAALYQESTDASVTVRSSSAEADDRLSGREERSCATDQENCSSISNTHKSPAEVTPVRRKRTLPKAADNCRKNARIIGEERVQHPPLSIMWLIRLQCLRKQTCCELTSIFFHFSWQIFSLREGGRRKLRARTTLSTQVAQKQLCAKQ